MNDANYTRNKISITICALYTYQNITSKFIAVISYAKNTTLQLNIMNNILHTKPSTKTTYNTRKWISNSIAPKLTARYLHNAYEATQYTLFPQPHILYSSFILRVSFIYVILYFNILITQSK